jgi:hypothetical protein
MPVEAGHSAAPPALRGVNPKRDRRFEARFLQRRVRSEPCGMSRSACRCSRNPKASYGVRRSSVYGIGEMVPNEPSVSPLGPAVKLSVLGLEFLPPPSVSVQSPSMTSGLLFTSRTVPWKFPVAGPS